jgi:hydrogenase nickel incorporation protein HypA/HybF
VHELSIALSLLDAAASEAQRHGAVQVVAIHLKLGPLSGVAKEALLSAYELAREQGPLAEARLVIEESPVLGHCPTCHTTRAVVSMQHLACVECGTPTPQLVSGRELEMVALEIR